MSCPQSLCYLDSQWTLVETVVLVVLGVLGQTQQGSQVCQMSVLCPGCPWCWWIQDVLAWWQESQQLDGSEDEMEAWVGAEED